MMTTEDLLYKDTIAADAQVEEVLAEDTVKKAFGGSRGALKVLETGPIGPDAVYELSSGSVPHTGEEFYAVNVSSLRPGNGLDNWLMSGVFWSRHEAVTYIHYLKSGGARF